MSMNAGGRYLKCDRCPAVLDRRPPGDHRNGGTFKYPEEIFAYAKTIGWTINGEHHECPTCSDSVHVLP